MARHRLIGLSTAGAALTILALLFQGPAPPWVQTMHLSLEAASFGELNSRASVELGGVKVGTVDGLELRGGRPLIDISVDPTYADLLHGDASAVIRPHGLLGPRYVELDGGSRGRLVDGATIPSSRVHVATDVDLVLNALQPDVRLSLQMLIVELGTASEGRGQDVNATLKSLGDAADDLATVTATLRRRDQDLSGSVVAAERLNRDVQNAPLSAQIQDTNRVLTGLVQVNSSIGHGIDHTATTLQALDVVLDGNSENLSRTLDQAPATVTRLRAVLASATGLVSAVNPTVPSLMTAIVETESSFSGSDANGHFVRVMSLAGSCSVGLNAGCAAPAATATPGQTNTAPSSSVSAPAANPAPIPRPRLSDQELLRLFLGDH